MQKTALLILSLSVCLQQSQQQHSNFCMQAALSAAKQERRSVQCATLHVDSSNTPAVQLYTAFGFEQDGFLENYYSEGSHAFKMLYNLSI